MNFFMLVIVILAVTFLISQWYTHRSKRLNQQIERAVEIDSRKQELLKAMLVKHEDMDPETRKEHLANVYMLAEQLREIDPNFPDILWKGVKEEYERKVLGDNS